MRKVKRPPTRPPSSQEGARGRLLIISVLLFLSVLAVYQQAGGHPFSAFDDTVYVTKNPHVLSGLNADSIRWAFTSPHGSNWHPLTGISLMADVQLSKWLNPTNPAAVFHWTNVILHAANAVLLLIVLNVATGSLWRSAFVAALFALHPLHVETVAWIADRKDVLSTLFWLLATWAYIAMHRNAVRSDAGKAAAMHRMAVRADARRRLLYAATLICFALALMSKPMAVTFPLTLLLLDLWPLKRLTNPPTRQLIIEKLPMFALAAGSCMLTLWAQKAGGSVVTLTACPIGLRIPAAIAAYPTYLLKTICPINLAAFYPHPAASIPLWQVVASAVFILAATFATLRFARRAPYLTVGWLWFMVTLLPVIGLVQVGMQFIADRYTYLPLVGIFIIIAWGIPALATRIVKNAAPALAVTAVVILAILTSLTTARLAYWQDDVKLLGHTIAVTRGNYFTLCLLGDVLQSRGDQPGAIDCYKRSIAINPAYGNAHYNLANVLFNTGRAEEAVAHYRAALRIFPDRSQVYNNLACALNALGRTAEAEQRFRQAVDRDPANAEAHYNLAALLLAKGERSEAIEHLRAAHRLAPTNPTVEAALNQALQQSP